MKRSNSRTRTLVTLLFAFMFAIPAIATDVSREGDIKSEDQKASGSLVPQRERAVALPAVTLRGITLQMVRVPGGQFDRRAAESPSVPAHRVQVPAFDLAKTEVTVRQFRTFVAATGYRTDAEREGWTFLCCWSKEEGANWRKPGFPQSDEDPVMALSWSDAQEFVKWLSKETGDDYRLPSEAEWEYAARAGSQADFPADVDAYAWYSQNSEGKSHPVGQKQPNAWGLYDMLGNAWEWAADVWANDYTGAPTDGSARRDAGTAGRGFGVGEGRPLRGGGWGLGRGAMRFDQRAGFELHNRCNNSGLRVARSIQGTVALPR